MKGMVIKMSKYTPVFEKKYPDGFVDAPPKETPLTAEIFNNYDEALIAIESFISELPETTEDSNENTGADIELENLVVTNSISLGRKADTDIGKKSTAEGTDVTASGTDSHAEGEGTIASGNCSHAQGKYNIEVANKYAHIVGNGTSDTARSNAHTLDWTGNAWFAGDVYTGGTGQDDENAKKLATEQYVLDQIAELNAAIEELNNKLSSLSSTASE